MPENWPGLFLKGTNRTVPAFSELENIATTSGSTDVLLLLCQNQVSLSHSDHLRVAIIRKNSSAARAGSPTSALVPSSGNQSPGR